MSDDQSENIIEEQVVDQQPEAVEQPQGETEEASVQQKPEPKTKDAAYNFAELRRQREDDRRRAEEAERRANELFELLKQSTGAKTKEERDELGEEIAKYSPEDLATIGNVDKKIDHKFKKKDREVASVRQELADLKAQIEEQKFRARYPDIEEVLSPDNIELLRKEDPEIAQMIGNMKNTQEQAALAYKYIKRMLPPKQEVSSEKKRALDNSKKPLSVQAISKTSAIGNAHAFENGLTKEDKARYWKETQDAMKRG